MISITVVDLGDYKRRSGEKDARRCDWPCGNGRIKKCDVGMRILGS